MTCSKPSFFFFLAALGCLTLNSSHSCADPSLEFSSAYQQLLTSAFQVKAANAEVEGKEAERWQAGAYPNPALGANLSSIGRNQDGDENQIYVGITQLVELGGKRSARLRVAHASQTSSEWNVEIAKNELYAKLLHAFITMAAAQERSLLASGQQKIAEETLNAISAKAASGNSSGIEERKAQVAFRRAKLEYLKQCSQLRKAKKQLLGIWSLNPPIFECVDFPLYAISIPPSLDALLCSLKCNPELIKAEAEASLAGEMTYLERTRRIPDLAIQVGVTTEKFVQVPALTVGFNIPLPLFDQNEGNISRASYEQLQAIYEQMDLENDLKNTLEVVYHEWTSAYEQATNLQELVLPSAESAYQLAQAGYDEGKFDYLELLDARSTLFNVQQQYLDIIEEYNHKKADVLKLTTCSPPNEI